MKPFPKKSTEITGPVSIKDGKITRLPTDCPGCGKPFTTLFVCPDCWILIPPKDRMQLHSMHTNRQPTASKLDKVVRELNKSEKIK